MVSRRMRHIMKKEIKILKALANEKRIEILQLLKQAQDLNVGQIAEKINLSFRSTSKHLQKLVEAGLIEQKRDGLYMIHNLVKEVQKLLDVVASRFKD